MRTLVAIAVCVSILYIGVWAGGELERRGRQTVVQPTIAFVERGTAQMPSEVSDLNDDGGFHLKYIASTGEQSAGDGGDDAFSSAFLMFDHLPDLTGKAFSFATLRITTSQVLAQAGEYEADEIFIAKTLPTDWTNLSGHATLEGLSLGSDTGLDLTPIASTTVLLDVSDELETIYLANSLNPACVTLKLRNAYWNAALSVDYSEAACDLGDRGGADGYTSIGNGATLEIGWTELASVLEDHRKKQRDYSMYILRQSTERTIRVGPAMDPADAVTPVTALTLSGADQAELLKAAGALTVSLAAAAWGAVADCDGWYNLTLTTSHTDTLGDVEIVVQDADVSLPVHKKGVVIPAPVYDALFAGTDYLQTDVIQLGSDAQSGTDLKHFADSGYDPSTSKVTGVKLVDTTTVNTDMVAAAPTVQAIWEELIGTHDDVAGSFAEALASVGVPATASAIAEAVLKKALEDVEATATDKTLAGLLALMLNEKEIVGDYLIVKKADGSEFFRIPLVTSASAVPVVGTGTST